MQDFFSGLPSGGSRIQLCGVHVFFIWQSVKERGGPRKERLKCFGIQRTRELRQLFEEILQVGYGCSPFTFAVSL
jgi:hypothetical protein